MMLSETEVRNIRKMELERLEAMADIESRALQRVAISMLDLVLDD